MTDSSNDTRVPCNGHRVLMSYDFENDQNVLSRAFQPLVPMTNVGVQQFLLAFASRRNGSSNKRTNEFHPVNYLIAFPWTRRYLKSHMRTSGSLTVQTGIAFCTEISFWTRETMLKSIRAYQ
jgi:hypothetical protein